MKYRSLGRSGLKISPLCLGTMMFGGPTDEATATRIAAKAKEQGVNFIDTADGYVGGKSEEVTGRAIGNQRNDWVLATKLGNVRSKWPNHGGLSRKWVVQCCEESLRRLGTDYIDILYLHKEDHDTPLAETVRALGALQRDGKIRYFGVSNHRAWRIAEICSLCDQMGIDRPVVSQPYYHALYRVAEVEQLPVCANFGLGVVSYSPLARGVLTGKYQLGAEAAELRAGRADKRMLETEMRAETLEAAQKFKAYADKRGVAASHLAVAWVLNNKMISGVVAGPRTETQWDDYVKALDVKFTKEDEAFVDDLVAAGHPAAPGYNDPQYPIEGKADADMTGASTIDEAEVARFSALAETWWDPRGKMATLHKFNPVRLAYIRDAACKRFGRNPKHLDSLKDLRILDIGCGGGILSEPLARLGASVVGADPAEKNIAVAKVHAGQSGLTIDYRATTAEALADAGETFDIVLAMEVVEHVADVKLFVSRCAEMVRPGGLMIAATINRTLKSFALAIVGAEYVLRWLPRGTHSWDKFVTPDELEIAMERAGLSTTDERGVIYNLLADRWELSTDIDVNYMVLAEKAA